MLIQGGLNMAEHFEAMVRVVKVNNSGQIASGAPEDFLNKDVDKISGVVNHIVVNLQNNLKVDAEKHDSKVLALSEVELAFGIDFEAKTKLPIIGPILGIGVSAGATFQAHVKLTRSTES
jgi:hypothetical protein